MTQAAAIEPIDVTVEAVHAAGYRYTHDSSTNALRLSGVVQPETDWPGDLGVVPESLGEDGQAVQVLLLSRYATFPGCRVSARPIGLLEAGPPGARHSLLLAVPTADPQWATVADVQDLPAAWRCQLEAAVRSATACRWGPAAEAAAYLRAARRAYRMARAAREQAQPRGPLWAVQDRGLRRAQPSEAERHTEAEYTVFALPYRFQRYASECLLPSERLLYHVVRMPVRHGGRWGLGRQRVAHEALVIVTDQQVLVLIDVLPPDSTLVQWGYIARAAPLERVLAATVREADKLLWLDLVLATTGEPACSSIEFGPDQRAACDELAAVLGRFTPAQNARRLLRRYTVAPSAVTPTAEPFLGPDVVAALEADLQARLQAAEPVLARAIAPSASDGTTAPLLVAATPQRVLLVQRPTDKQKARPLPAEVALDECGAVELRNALLGGRFRLWRGGRAEPPTLEVDFPYPLVGAFQALFLTVRQLLAAPPGAPRPCALPEPAPQR
jgi:inorganic pyrophosphatase